MRLLFLTLPIAVSETALEIAEKAQRDAEVKALKEAENLATKCEASAHSVEGDLEDIKEKIKAAAKQYSLGIQNLIKDEFVIGEASHRAVPIIAVIHAFKLLEEFEDKIGQTQNDFKEVKKNLHAELVHFQKDLKADIDKLSNRQVSPKSTGELEKEHNRDLGYKPM